MEANFHYIIEYTLDIKSQNPILFDSNMDFSKHEHDEILRQWIKNFILKNLDTKNYKEGDVVYAKKIIVSECQGQEYKEIYSTDEKLKIYPPMDK